MKDRQIFIKNLYYMLAYVYDDLYKLESEALSFEKFADALNLLAYMLGKLVSRLVKRGLVKEYISKEENLQTVKGKINIDETIKLRVNRKNRVVCEYEALEVDNYLNRIVKTTLYYLILSKEVSFENKKILKKLLPIFKDVGLLDKSFFMKVSYNRQNIHYRDTVNLCYLILDDLLISTEPGDCRLAKFLSDKKMHRIYEKFVLKYYQKHYPNLRPSASRIKWNLDDGRNDLLPIMITDITLTYEDKSLIIDTKYYSRIINKNELYDSSSLHSSNLYQIFTYVKNKDIENTGKVSGVILYAQTDDEINLDNEYNMSGNKIYVKTLDLNRDFKFIKESLDNIAEKFVKEACR